MSLSPRIVNASRCAICGQTKAPGRSRCLACSDPVVRVWRMAHYERTRVQLAIRGHYCPECFQANADGHAEGCKVKEYLDSRDEPTAQQNHDALQAAGIRRGASDVDLYQFGEDNEDDYTGRGHR